MNGQPQDNGARQVWITETALATALQSSYMASQLALFAIVTGIALLLTASGSASSPSVGRCETGRRRSPSTARRTPPRALWQPRSVHPPNWRTAAATAVAAAAAFRLGRRSGVSAAELRAPLPGDGLVRRPTWSSTRATTIAAPPAAVWPWIVQMGYPAFRAGWYTPQWLDRLQWGIREGAQSRSGQTSSTWRSATAYRTAATTRSSSRSPSFGRPRRWYCTPPATS